MHAGNWTRFHISSVVLHPVSAQLPYFDSSGFWLVACARVRSVFKGMEGAVLLKRLFQLMLTGVSLVNLKQRPLSKKKKVKFIYRNSKGNILFILYIYLLYRVYF